MSTRTKKLSKSFKMKSSTGRIRGSDKFVKNDWLDRVFKLTFICFQICIAEGLWKGLLAGLYLFFNGQRIIFNRLLLFSQ